MNSAAQGAHSTRVGIWLRFALLLGLSISAILSSNALWVAIVLGMMLVVIKPASTVPLVIGILVWIPMRGIFSANASELVSTAVMAQNIEKGDLPREVAILSLCAIGFIFLWRARFRVGGVIALKCLFVYITLGLLSALWSADPMLTAKRVIAAGSCVVFAAGLAIGYYGQAADGGTRLVRHVCIMGSLACAAVAAVAIVAGNVHIFDLAWRLGSIGRENQISWVAAIPFLAAWITRGNRGIWPSSPVLIGALTITGIVLLLAKSRTSIIATAAGVLVCELLKLRSKRTIITIILIAAVLLVIGSSSWFNQFWMRGANEDELQSVSGRTILWEVVWRDVWVRPFVGYGYGGYWTPERVVSQEVEWAPTSAHNGYLDTTVELGFVGLAIVLAFIVICLREAARLMRSAPQSRHIGVLLLAITVWLIVINLTESYIDSLEYFPMLTTLTLAFYVSYLNAVGPALQPCASIPWQPLLPPKDLSCLQ